MTAPSPAPGLDPTTGGDAAAQIRRAVLWLILTFGGIANLIFASAGLTGIKDIPPDWQLYQVLGLGFLLAIGGVSLLLVLAARVFSASRFSQVNLVNDLNDATRNTEPNELIFAQHHNLQQAWADFTAELNTVNSGDPAITSQMRRDAANAAQQIGSKLLKYMSARALENLEGRYNTFLRALPWALIAIAMGGLLYFWALAQRYPVSQWAAVDTLRKDRETLLNDQKSLADDRKTLADSQKALAGDQLKLEQARTAFEQARLNDARTLAKLEFPVRGTYQPKSVTGQDKTTSYKTLGNCPQDQAVDVLILNVTAADSGAKARIYGLDPRCQEVQLDVTAAEGTVKAKTMEWTLK